MTYERFPYVKDLELSFCQYINTTKITIQNRPPICNDFIFNDKLYAYQIFTINNVKYNICLGNRHRFLRFRIILKSTFYT